jgi:hypothetical protein
MPEKKNRNQSKEQDLSKRSAEMAEGKNPTVAAAIYRKGDKYYCAECHSELPFHKDCPACRAHIEWDRILFENHP